MDERIKQSVLDKGRAVEALRRERQRTDTEAAVDGAAERVREELTRGMSDLAGMPDPFDYEWEGGLR